MARFQEDFLKYFPLQCNFFTPNNIRVMRKKFGAGGVLFYIYLQCHLYSNSYYIDLNKDQDFITLAAEDVGVSENTIRQVLKFLCERSMLDGTLFTEDNVLTSRDFQLQYQESMEKRNLGRDVVVDEKLWLLDESETLGFIKVRSKKFSSEKKEISSERKALSSEKKLQSKVNKKKVNKSSAGSCAPAAAFNSKEGLVEKYGVSAVAEYEARFRKWQTKQGAVRVEMYEAISKWMERDGVKPRATDNSSIDVDAAMKEILDKYKGGS